MSSTSPRTWDTREACMWVTNDYDTYHLARTLTAADLAELVKINAPAWGVDFDQVDMDDVYETLHDE